MVATPAAGRAASTKAGSTGAGSAATSEVEAASSRTAVTCAEAKGSADTDAAGSSAGGRLVSSIAGKPKPASRAPQIERTAVAQNAAMTAPRRALILPRPSLPASPQPSRRAEGDNWPFWPPSDGQARKPPAVILLQNVLL